MENVMTVKLKRLQAAMEMTDDSGVGAVHQLMDEDEQVLNENELTLAEISRSEDLRSNLLDLSAVVGSLESVTAVNASLIRIAANMALAGTAFNSDVFAPSLESVNDLAYSSETISESAKALFIRIIEALKKALAKIGAFFKNILGEVERVIRSNTALANNAKGKNGRSIKEAFISLRMEPLRLEVLGKLPLSAPEIVRGLKELHRQLDVVLGNYSSSTLAAGTDIKSAIGKELVPADKYKAGVDAALGKIDFKSFGSLLNVRAYEDMRFAKNEVKVSPAMMGNKSIFINDHGGGDLTKRYAKLSASTSAERRNPNGETSYSTIPASDIITVTAEIAIILKRLQAFDSNTMKPLSAMNTALISSIVEAQGKVALLTPSSEDNALYNKVDGAPGAYYRSSQSLQSQMCHHALAVCKAVISVCEMSLDAHA
jgi:hypothetical protein